MADSAKKVAEIVRKQWRVAKFLEDDDGTIFSIIPDSWCRVEEGQTFALWPKRGSTNVKELIKTCSPPSADWPLYLVLEITEESIADYSLALDYEKIIVAMKSVQRGFKQKKASLETNKRVKIVKSQKMPGEDSSSDSSQSKLIETYKNKIPKPPSKHTIAPKSPEEEPPKKKSMTTEVSGEKPPNKSAASAGKGTPGMLIKSSQGSKVYQEKVADHPSTSSQIIQTPSQTVAEPGVPSSNTNEDAPLSEELLAVSQAETVAIVDGQKIIAVNANVDLQTPVLTTHHLEVLKQAIVKEVKDFFVGHMSQLKDVVTEVRDNQIGFFDQFIRLGVTPRQEAAVPYRPNIDLPVKSIAELQHLEDTLEIDGALRAFMFNEFSGILSPILGEFVRKNLIKVMTNNVAMAVCMKGRAKNKAAMTDSKNLLQILKSAAERVPGRYDEINFNKQISNWLQQGHRRRLDDPPAPPQQ